MRLDKSLFLSRAWCLVLYSLAVALLNYIETYESLNSSLNVLVWLHPSFLPPASPAAFCDISACFLSSSAGWW